MTARLWRSRQWLLVCVGLAVLSACKKDERSEQARPPALSERMGLQAAPPTRLSLGEDCSRYEGSTGCASGLCLRMQPGFPPKGYCSQRCGPVFTPNSVDGGLEQTGDIACPTVAGEKWACHKIMPTADGFACVRPGSRRDRAPSTDADGGQSDGGAP